jgi:hypothetical protein
MRTGARYYDIATLSGSSPQIRGPVDDEVDGRGKAFARSDHEEASPSGVTSHGGPCHGHGCASNKGRALPMSRLELFDFTSTDIILPAAGKKSAFKLRMNLLLLPCRSPHALDSIAS